MKKLIFAFVFGIFSLSACSFEFGGAPPADNSSPARADAAENVSEAAKPSGGADSENENSDRDQKIFEGDKKAAADCRNIDTGEKRLLAGQTFPIDFAPFKGSCFVTAHDPAFTDPPLHSEFSIYRDGEEIFFFPKQFNGVSTGCWVEAVSFEDLNNDNLKEIIVVGKCSAKSAPYNENMVYVNTGTSFITNEDANYKLADFQKIREIKDFVRRNQQLFF